eukprot:9470766-Karenia_brevis.AAC.1
MAVDICRVGLLEIMAPTCTRGSNVAAWTRRRNAIKWSSEICSGGGEGGHEGSGEKQCVWQ